jgi:excisionase family DNA binding protein
MITSLRTAIEFTLGLVRGCTVDEIAGLAETTHKGAQVFVTSLLNQRVLVLNAGYYSAGPMADKWKAIKPNTHRGGGAKKYLLSKKVRDAITVRDWKDRRGEGPVLTTGIYREGANMSNGSRRTEVQPITLERRFYSVREFAKIIGRSERTIRHWILVGELRVSKIGGTILIPKSSADALEAVY